MSQPSRREFMKTSSVAALGAGVLNQLAAGAYAAGDDTIRIGLVGCGGRGSGATEQALKTEGNVKLVAMGDAFPDALEGSLNNLRNMFTDKPERIDVPKERQYVGFDAYKQVVDSDIDLVIFASPPGFRPIHFDYAVQKGRNVFMEKPVAIDAPGVRMVLKAAEVAKQKNLKVGVGLQRHHEAKYLDMLKRIHDGAIGDLVALRMYWNGGGVWEPRKKREECKSEMEYQMRNWYYYNWLCGDHICEQHIHNLDVGCWLKGKRPVKANGMGGRQVRTDKRYGEIYDHHAVEYTFDDGSVMFSQCRHIPNCWDSVTEHVHGTKGWSDVSGGVLKTYAGEEYRHQGKGKNPYQVEHDDLFAAIRNNTPYSEAENGALSSMTSILGRMCTYSGKEITWNAALNSEISLMPKVFSFDAPPPVLPNAEGVYPIAVPGVTKTV